MRQADKSRRISVRLTRAMDQSLRRRAALTGEPESRIVREALQTHLAESDPGESAYALARRIGLAGSAKGLPRDLSTNPKHLAGFGK